MIRTIKTVYSLLLLILPLSVLLTIGAGDIHAANVSALSFDGSNDYINANTVSDRLAGANTFSFGGWIRVANTTTGMGIGGFYSPQALNRNFLFVNGAGFESIIRYADLNAGSNISSSTITANTWIHTFVTVSSGNVTLYINGVGVGTSTTTTTPDQNGRFTIGQDWDAGPNATDFFKGQMDEIRVYSIALTREQIQQEMYRELTGTETGLVAYFKMDENTGCTLTDSAGGDDPGTLIPTTCPADGPVYTQEMPTLNNVNPDLPPGTVTNSRGGWLYSGRTVGATGTTITKVDYSVNGGGFMGATATDGAFNANGENFEAFFQSTDNGNSYPGYILELRTVDNTEKNAKRTHFDPFSLSSVRKLADGQLELTFNVNKQRSLMKDQLDRYKIIYTGDGLGDKTLLDDIPIDFEAVRSKLQNQANNDITCDPCVYDNHKMKVSYSNNNSQLTVVTKKAPAITGNTTFKVMAVSPDKFEQNSNSLTLASSSSQITSSATDQLTSTSQTSTKPEETTTEEQSSQKKLPGQKTTFETTTSTETGPIAGVINTIVDLFTKIVNSVTRLVKG